MLKKKDLAKEFELVVQQEIKNYQDSLNGILQAIRDIRSDVEKIDHKFEEKNKKFDSSQSQFFQEIRAIREEIKSYKEENEKKYRDQRVVNQRNSEIFHQLESAILKSHFSRDSFKEDLDDIVYRIWSVERNFSSIKVEMSQEMEKTLRKCFKKVENAKEEIRKDPSEVPLLKLDLEEKIYSHKVDVQGLLKEIQIVKKEDFIRKKEIEHLSTQIKRLKGEK